MSAHITSAELASYKNEETIQREVAAWLDVSLPKDWRWYHCPNGGARSKAAAGKLKAQGVKRGVFDIIICPPVGHDIWIELKAAGNYLSVEQRQWMEWRKAHGRPSYVARSLGEVITHLKDHLAKVAA